MSRKESTSRWIPYLVDQDGKKTLLILEREYHSVPEMQEFFANIATTHPHLKGLRIDFEEETGSPVLVDVRGIYGSKGD